MTGLLKQYSQHLNKNDYLLKMNKKTNIAIERLNTILPLKNNQQTMPAEIQDLHRQILNSYIEIGRSLNKNEITQHFNNIDEVIDILQKNDMVIFDKNGEPVGAYPFTMEKREHKIKINGHNIYSMCALDSLAISPMYNTELEINSKCHVTGKDISVKQHGYTIINSRDVKELYFGINWNAACSTSCCADSLCTEMIFLKGDSVANNWLNEAPDNRQTFTLDEAIEFAAGFFVPLIK